VPKKGYKQSKKHKKNISDSHKGKISGMKNKKHSIEAKIKMSLISKGRTKSESHINNMKKPKSTECINNMKLAKNIGRFKKGNKSYWKGKKISLKHRKKLSISHKGKNIKNKDYSGKYMTLSKLIRSMPEYRQWRSNCFTRDNWTCQTCNKRGGYLEIHHIKSIKKIILGNNIKGTLSARNCKELWDINNGVTLCKYCHSLTYNYKGKSSNKW